MTGGKVIQYSKTFLKICLNRQVDDSTGRVCHQTTHTSQLTNLLFITTGTGNSHHVYRVKAFLVTHYVVHHGIRYIFRSLCPKLNCFTIAFIFGNQTATIQTRYFIYIFIRFAQNRCFFFRYFNIGNSDCHTRTTCKGIAQWFYAVEKFRRLFVTE